MLGIFDAGSNVVAGNKMPVGSNLEGNKATKSYVRCMFHKRYNKRKSQHQLLVFINK